MTKKYPVVLMMGDGIGPEVVEGALHVLKASGVSFDWTLAPIGETAFRQFGQYLPDHTMQALKKVGLAIKGPTMTPVGEGHSSVNVLLRQEFQLHTNMRPVSILPRAKTRYGDLPIDMVIFRENLQDLYGGFERPTRDGFFAEAVFTRPVIERFARHSFRIAEQVGRKKMTVIHKANILKKTHGLFLAVAKEVARDFPSITCNDLIADNFCAQVVQWPHSFDCVLAPNYTGDLISDLCAGLVGGLGFAPGANLGDHCAVFEAVHGTAPDIAGKWLANPTAMILSGAMMLDYLREHAAAERVRKAVAEVLRKGEKVTRDVNVQSGVGTLDYAKAVADEAARL